MRTACASEVPHAELTVPSRLGRTLRRVIARTVAVALVLLAVAGGASASGGGTIVFSADNAPKVQLEIYRLDPDGRRVDLSRSAFRDEQPIVAPAGGHVAFLSDRSGASAVYTVRLDGTHLRRVTSTTNDSFVYAWSPDGATLAVAAARPGVLSRIYLDAHGRLRLLTRTTGTWTTGLWWTPDGKLLTALDDGALDAFSPVTGRRVWSVQLQSENGPWTAQGLFAGEDAKGHLIVLDERGRVVDRFPASGAPGNALFSPDGTMLALEEGRWLEIRTAHGRLLHRIRAVPQAFFTWTGIRTLYVGTATGASEVDAATGRSRAVPSGGWTVQWLGRYGAATAAHGSTFAIQLVTASGRRTFGTVPGCNSDGNFVAAASSVQPTPGGRSIVYTTDCEEPFANLYSIAGGVTRRLTRAERQQVSPTFSPDGTKLAYIQSPAVDLSCKGCASTLWTANADGSSPLQLTDIPDCTFDAGPAWSPDGTRIAFSRSGCDSEPELYTIAAGGGPATDLHLAGMDAAWGPTRIAYVDPNTGVLWTALPDGSGSAKVEPVQKPKALSWSHDGRLAFAAQQRDGTIRIGIWNGGSIHFFETPFVAVTTLDWLPDGTSFVATARARGGATTDVYTFAVNGTNFRRRTWNVDASGVTWSSL